MNNIFSINGCWQRLDNRIKLAVTGRDKIMRYPHNLNCSRPRLLGLVMLLSGLFSGCASDPPLLNTATTPHRAARHQISRHKAAYNRPYKVKSKTYHPMPSAAGYSEQGIASWYGYESGDRTSMGTRFKPHEYTAAHKTLPLPSRVRVTNLHNGHSI